MIWFTDVFGVWPGSRQNMANFQGPIPHQLFKPALRHMELSGNGHIGTIPTEIGLAGSLIHFQIDGNALTGMIPTEIGRNSILKYL
jgi:hypothetical protein